MTAPAGSERDDPTWRTFAAEAEPECQQRRLVAVQPLVEKRRNDARESSLTGVVDQEQERRKAVEVALPVARRWADARASR